MVQQLTPYRVLKRLEASERKLLAIRHLRSIMMSAFTAKWDEIRKYKKINFFFYTSVLAISFSFVSRLNGKYVCR